MNTIKYSLLLCILIALACKGEVQKQEDVVVFNEELVTTLSKMAEVDQYYAGIPQGEHEGDWDTWIKIRDSINRKHQKILQDIIEMYGYPGFDRVGESGESDFWVMVQHSDFDPEWQTSVLLLLKQEVDKNNATPAHYGLLTDRVLVNSGEPQLYGTQRHFNELGQAYIKELQDRKNVNKRRALLGMETLEEYLNEATLFHFEMNKEYLKEKGITEPTLYPLPKE